ncbi:MAG: hypothetical protein WA755_15255 [Candidatus Acidiferrales bacterium]
MQEISVLRPNVSREEAIAALRPGGFTGVVRDLAVGPLRSIADVYVPFRLFRAVIENGRAREERWLAIDMVEGSLDPYGFDARPDSSAFARIETRNSLPALISDDRGAEMLRLKVQRLIFRLGFFRARNLAMEFTPIALDIHVPYWLAFRGRGERAHLDVLDAVRRRPEGARARQLFRSWLLNHPAPALSPSPAHPRS